MRTIYKFPIAVASMTKVDAPASAQIRLVALDPTTGAPAIWIEMDTSARYVMRRFIVHGTGQPIGGNGGFPSPIHVGSVIDRTFVWHIFEVRD